MIRLLLVDDQSLIRRGLKALLETDTEFAVVGEASNGQEAVELVAQLQPDVVLMDVQMPIVDGVAGTREISQRFPQTRVLVLTTFPNNEYVTQALQAGAAGYLLKNTPFEELTQAIRLVQKGYTQIGPGLSQAVFQQPVQPIPTAQSIAWDVLTPREQEIVGWIVRGASNREIAQALYISEKTVKNNITNILSRLDLRDRTQLAITALQQGVEGSPSLGPNASK
jgi:DNA-binding NarL/FixJ family response regulator